MISADEYILTFPNGEIVGEGELEMWLEQVNAEPKFNQDQRDTARAIVWRIRALAN